MNYEILISFIGASMLLTLMPGPDILYVLMQSITNGKKYGIVTAFGLVSGVIIHTTLVAFGVSAIIKHSENLFLGLKVVGALYLLFLAYKSLVSKEVIHLDKKVSSINMFKLYRRGFLMNVINPKVSIFFLAFFPGFLYSSTQNTIIQFYVLGILFMLQAFIIFTLVSILSGQFSSYLNSHKSFSKNIKWFKVIVFIAIAIFILFS
ncbi:LysE family translocator [Lutibacter sp.]|uniref:LysE family translocator n=1 Tax=Lutibacter sp. TaxID=1925666 RepID=UPI0025B9E495|nr:LysE family translocator [Lutibacter sp.]MCF6182609.1 LysE family translocator [Lutibacter sp.]